MKNLKLLGFIIRSVVMGMIAALFLFAFFPHLIIPVVEAPEKQQPIIQTQADITPLSFASAIKKAAPSVVNIGTYIPDPIIENKGRLGMGSGVIVSTEGYIVTNYHVVAKAIEIAIELTDGRTAIAEVIGFDTETDLAVLKIPLDNLPVISTDSEVNVQVGDITLIIGNPFGVGQAVTMGIVSATGRRFVGLSEYAAFIQTDAAVNPGNSGGAIINSSGELIGISSAYFTRGTKTGISFAIPTSLTMEVMKEIVVNGRVVRGWLGFGSNAAKKLYGENAFFVDDVSAGGPADLAGMKVGDAILSMNNKTLKSVIDIQKLVSESIPGETIKIIVKRDQKVITLIATVQERPERTNTLR